MYHGYRVIVCIPFGRRKFTDILLRYLLREYSIIDEIRLWMNTECQDDISWAKEKSLAYSKVTLDDRTVEKKPLEPWANAFGLNKFYDNCNDEQTIYIKIDDDIIWLEENFIKNILEFRVDNPEYFLVSANIINNAICDYIHQNIGVIPGHPKITYSVSDISAWKNPLFAENKHRIFLKYLSSGNTEGYKFDKHVLLNQEGFSINCICWFGVWPDFRGTLSNKTFYELCGKRIMENDEKQLTEDFTKSSQSYNCICGKCLCSHFSFWTQIDYMSKTNILEDYKDACRDLGLYNE